MIPHSALRQRIQETAIGYAGIDGLWWLPAVEPCRLPPMLGEELSQVGSALFVFFDTVATLYSTAAGEAGGLRRLLAAHVPAPLTHIIASGRVELVRPDFQLVSTPADGYRLVATELEICPAAQGYAHAMQVAYGLPTDLADQMASWLRGRPLLFVGTEQWSEFLFEQLAFCRALAERGATAYVLYDRPLRLIAAEVLAGKRWQPPLFGVERRPEHWDTDILGRIQSAGLSGFLWPDERGWPDQVGPAVIFRFGYVDCFSSEHLLLMRHWQERGATFLNPPTYFLDSKTLMATLQLPVVRRQVGEKDSQALTVLDRAIPETLLLEHDQLARLQRERVSWVIKFAGFDRGNQAWGGRSLHSGAASSPEQWQELLVRSLRLPWPVVAQRVTPSVPMVIDYLDAQERRQSLSGTTRIRSFLLRPPDGGQGAWVGGTHLTVAPDPIKVAEGMASVQAPVLFGDDG